MKKLLVAIALLAWTFSGLNPSTSLAAATGPPYEINAVLSLTGPAAFLGSKEAQSLQVAETMLNKDGGIQGRPIKFVIEDDGSVPQNAVQLFTGLIARKVPIVIGPSVVATCSAVRALVDNGNSGPVTYCLAPPVQAPVDSYMFTAQNTQHDFLLLTLRALRNFRWSRIALITATDASGQAYERDFDSILATPEAHRITVVDREHFNPADVSMAAQVARIKSAAPDVILSFTVGTSFGTLLRQLNDIGMNVAVFGSGSNLNYAQLESYRDFTPEPLFFASSGGGMPDPKATSAVKTAQSEFFNAFNDAGVRPEVLHTVAWDPANLAVQAIRKLGTTATASQIHDYLMNLQNWAGDLGIYDFRATPQRGIGSKAARLYRWDSSTNKISVVSVP